MSILVYYYMLLVYALPWINLYGGKSTRGKYPRLELWKSRKLKEVTQELSLEIDNTNLVTNTLLSYGFSQLQISNILLSMSYTSKMKPDVLYHEFLRPKLDFLQASTDGIYSKNHTYHNDINDYGEYFGLSLEKHIAPRFSYLRNFLKKTNHQEIFTDNYSIRDILSPTNDEDFCLFLSNVFGSENSMLHDYLEFKSKFFRGGIEAIRRNDHDMLLSLLECGYDPSSDVDRSGRSPLLWACSMKDSKDIVKTLLYYFQLSMFDVTNNGDTVFHWAATSNSIEICKFLLSRLIEIDPKKENYIMQINKELSSPLHWSCGSGSLSISKWLIEEIGMDINQRNVFGCKIEHFATSGGKLEICQYLYSLGCTFEDINHHGHDCLTKAIAFKRNDVVKWLLDTFPTIKNSLETLRPWTFDTTNSKESTWLSLSEIAKVVGNNDAIKIIQSYRDIK